jgi:hypothetical protein
MRRILSILLVLAAGLTVATPAIGSQRDLNTRLLTEYVKNGRLNACNYTQAELKGAINSIPEDLKQYGAPLIAAIDDAIAARAQGACNKTKKQVQQSTDGQAAAAPPAGQAPPPPPASSAQATQAPGAPPAAKAPPTPTAEPTPVAQIATDNAIPIAAHTTAVATDTPAPLILLAILAGLLAFSGLAFAVIRWFAWDPAWAVRFRHAAGEAGWRASSTFSEFADFVRMGR